MAQSRRIRPRRWPGSASDVAARRGGVRGYHGRDAAGLRCCEAFRAPITRARAAPARADRSPPSVRRVRRRLLAAALLERSGWHTAGSRRAVRDRRARPPRGIGIVSAVTEMPPGDAPPRRPRAALPTEVRLTFPLLLSPHRPCRRGQVRRLRRGGERGRAARRCVQHAGRALLAARPVAAEGDAERLDLRRGRWHDDLRATQGRHS